MSNWRLKMFLWYRSSSKIVNFLVRFEDPLTCENVESHSLETDIAKSALFQHPRQLRRLYEFIPIVGSRGTPWEKNHESTYSAARTSKTYDQKVRLRVDSSNSPPVRKKRWHVLRKNRGSSTCSRTSKAITRSKGIKEGFLKELHAR